MRRGDHGRLRAVLIAAMIMVAIPSGPASAAPVTAFTLDSQPGDYIGQGQSLVYTPPGATISASASGSGGVYMSVSQDGHWWNASISPPTGQSLAAGTYSTTRFPSSSAAGLDVSGDGRGCNTSTGSLTVLEVSFDSDGNPLTFAASYEQHCEGDSEALFGELRYSSGFEFRAASTSPSALTFSGQLVGTSSAPQTVTISNTGSVALTLGSATVGGTNPGDFSVTSDACSGSTLDPAATCNLSVEFSPSGGGSRTARLEVPDGTTRGAREVPLTGTGNRLTTSLSLSRSRLVVNYKGSVTVTTHLDAHQVVTNKTVSIYKTPYGGGKTLVKAAQVDGSGNLSATVTLSKNTTFVAEWAGEETYDPATSPSKVVKVRVIAKAALLDYYGSSGKYKLYHLGDSVPQKGTVVPNHAGKPLDFLAQKYLDGRWRTVATGTFTITSSGSVIAVFQNGNRGTYRAKTRFDGDLDHLGDSSPWRYFKIT
jgi:hypothetical protein